MKNYASEVAKAGIGRTPRLCQDALAEMLADLFKGKLFTGQDGKKELRIFKQDLPITEDSDDDADTEKAVAPYIVVEMTGGKVRSPIETQIIEFSLVICCYDASVERVGYQDVANIKEDIVQQICAAPYFGGCFTILNPIAWAMQKDDTMPYYYAAVSFDCTAPVMTQETEMKRFL